MAAHFLCLLLCYINCNWVARIAISPRSESNRLQDRGAEPGLTQIFWSYFGDMAGDRSSGGLW